MPKRCAPRLRHITIGPRIKPSATATSSDTTVRSAPVSTTKRNGPLPPIITRDREVIVEIGGSGDLFRFGRCRFHVLRPSQWPTAAGACRATAHETSAGEFVDRMKAAHIGPHDPCSWPCRTKTTTNGRERMCCNHVGRGPLVGPHTAKNAPQFRKRKWRCRQIRPV